MEKFNNLFSEISEFLRDNEHLIVAYETIDVKRFEEREKFLPRLNMLKEKLLAGTNLLTDTINSAKNTHESELAAMDALVNRGKKKEKEPEKEKDDKPWLTISRGKKVETAAPQPPAAKLIAPEVKRIKFTEALSLSALSVPTFGYVKKDGELYYVECADHFAFRLSGHLFHGNIGTIYTEEKNPEKIKNCKFASGCMKQNKCDYYHDPVDFPGSKDRRNFIASSWLYSPPEQFNNRARSRRFGSRAHLDTDIIGLQPEEISRFQDQTMHDILCSLLLGKTYKK